MEKIKLWVESQASHMGQIITGFLMLKEQGWDVEVIDNVQDSGSFYHGMMPFIRAEYRGKKIVYDMGDGYNVPEDIQTCLDHCDFLFKRSFSAEKNRAMLRNYEEKMHPLGLYFRVTHPKSPINEPLWKALVKTLMGKASTRYFVPKVFAGKPEPEGDRPVRILFLTQLWNDHEPGFSDEENAERTYINQMRIDIIRALRERYGDAFIGGLNDNALSRTWAPDLIMPAEYTERKRYLKLVHSCDVCIGSMGLFESIGGKTAEYVAAAKAIVNERLHYSVTGDFAEGVHYLSFETVEECLTAVQKLVEDPRLRLSMKQANAEYYSRYLRPDMLVKNTLELVDQKIEEQQKKEFAKI